MPMSNLEVPGRSRCWSPSGGVGMPPLLSLMAIFLFWEESRIHCMLKSQEAGHFYLMGGGIPHDYVMEQQILSTVYDLAETQTKKGF